MDYRKITTGLDALQAKGEIAAWSIEYIADKSTAFLIVATYHVNEFDSEQALINLAICNGFRYINSRSYIGCRYRPKYSPHDLEEVPMVRYYFAYTEVK